MLSLAGIHEAGLQVPIAFDAYPSLLITAAFLGRCTCREVGDLAARLDSDLSPQAPALVLFDSASPESALINATQMILAADEVLTFLEGRLDSLPDTLAADLSAADPGTRPGMLAAMRAYERLIISSTYTRLAPDYGKILETYCSMLANYPEELPGTHDIWLCP